MNNKNIKLIFIDTFVSMGTLYFSFLLRYEFQIPAKFFDVFISWLPTFVLVQGVIFLITGLYNRMWRYTSLLDLYAILRSCATAWAIGFVAIYLSMGAVTYPRSVLLLYLIFNTIFIIGVRLSVRVYWSHYNSEKMIIKSHRSKKRLLLIGAGKTGDKIAREILFSAQNYIIVGFIDDDPEKREHFCMAKEFCVILTISPIFR